MTARTKPDHLAPFLPKVKIYRHQTKTQDASDVL